MSVTSQQIGRGSSELAAGAGPPRVASAALGAAGYRLAKEQARRGAPNVFFASQFLSRPRRQAVLALLAVYRQLGQIIGGSGAGAGGPDSESSSAATAQEPACPGRPSTCERGEACASAASCAGAASCEGSASCAGAGESPEARQRVCMAVMDHLYRGEPTGRPELDIFPDVATQYALPRAGFDTLIEALVSELTVQRYATWNRLRTQLDRTTGVAGELVFRLLAPKRDAGDAAAVHEQTVMHQVHAWCAAMRMSVVLSRVGEHARAGRLYLPLDDLVTFGISEREVFARAADDERAGSRAGSRGNPGSSLPADSSAADLAADPRWRELMAFEVDRVRNLYRGGAKCLSALADDRCRRAAAVMGSLYRGMIDELASARIDPFAVPRKWTLWDRLRRVPGAMRLSVNPSRVARLY